MSEPAPVPERLPVSVITGFIGSGMSETAVIINEFGEIGLDHLLVEAATDDTVLLNSGCLCCTIRGDLIDTMRRLYERRERKEIPAFARLVIETTGLADPAPILHTLMQDPLLTLAYRLDGIVATVDAVNGWDQLDRQRESVKQAAVADRIVLTKGDLAKDEAVEKLKQRLRRLNPAAPILAATHGAVDPARLFDAGLYDPRTKSVDVRRWLNEEAYRDAGHAHDHDHPGAHDHSHARGQSPEDHNRHDAHVRAFCLTYDRPLDWQRFTAWIDMLVTTRGPDLLRIKGILNVADQTQPIAIHGVQHLFHPPALLPSWPDADRHSRIVFITRDFDIDTLSNSFDAFQREDTSP
jgi:G3E family GTPase